MLSEMTTNRPNCCAKAVSARHRGTLRTFVGFYPRDNAAAFGRQGGRRCRELHGREHMRSIGARGFSATVARHWAGDRAGYVAWLRDHARFAIIEAAAEVLLAAGVRCLELDGNLPEASELPF